MCKKLLFHFRMVCLVALLFTVVGCRDKDYYNPDPIENVGLSKLSFSTTKSVELNLNYQTPVGFVSTFEAYIEYPLDNEGVLKKNIYPITAGIHISGVSKIKRVLPAYVNELYVYSTDLFIPRLLHATIDNTTGVASFKQVSITTTSQSAPATRIIGDGRISTFLKSVADFYDKNKYSSTGELLESKYDLINPDQIKPIPSEMLTAISQTFPEEKKAKAEYMKDASIEIKSDPNKTGVNLYVSVIYAGGQFNNSLSYFVYEGAKELKDLTASERNTLEIINIFQLADIHSNSFKNKGMGLTPGHYVQLKYRNAQGQYVNEFPVGAKIGWVLHSNGFDSTNFGVMRSQDRIYSISSWNKNSAKKTIYFGVTDDNRNEYICFGFEDQLTAGDDDCNDVLFHVDVDPIEAVNPPSFIPVEGIIHSSATYHGVLTFEDSWPQKGDYDLNDVVVKYTSTINYVQAGRTTETGGSQLVGYGDIAVESTKDVFSFIHTGADFDNAFAYKVNIDPSKVKEVKITDNESNTFAYSIKSDGNGFIIQICPNVKDVIPPMAVVTTPAVYSVETIFMDNVKDSDFEECKSPYNPYIKPKNTAIPSDGIEVHLPFYYPTSTVDHKLFQTESDVSEPAKGIYYASRDGAYYPFALHLAGVTDFKIPVEGKSIDISYPKYTDWVNNGCGTVSADWYLP